MSEDVTHTENYGDSRDPEVTFEKEGEGGEEIIAKLKEKLRA